ncbi:MAG: hypothetical protein DRH11_17590 [Deltaproteobacteria bacterium]|nr:MAG: hypothetical protein DRH11_17590 [Deltaproteobacteria bacterium]
MSGSIGLFRTVQELADTVHKDMFPELPKEIVKTGALKAPETWEPETAPLKTYLHAFIIGWCTAVTYLASPKFLTQAQVTQLLDDLLELEDQLRDYRNRMLDMLVAFYPEAEENKEDD